MNSKTAAQPDASATHVPRLGRRPSARFLQRMYSALGKKLGNKGWLSQAEFNDAFRHARAHAGGMSRVEKRMLRDSQHITMDEGGLYAHATAAGSGSAVEDAPRGAMIAWFVPPDVAALLAQPGGEAPEDLHVTLCYLGLDADLDDVTKARIVTTVQTYCAGMSPLAGQVSGVGRFNPASEGDDDGGLAVVYASVDVPNLEDCQDDLCDSLECWGIDVSDDHGFTPHITVQYSDAPSSSLPTIPTTPVTIDALTVAFGATRVVIPLVGSTQEYAERPGTRRFTWEPDEHPTAAMDWIHFIPRPGNYEHPLWGTIEISRALNEEFVRNMSEEVYQDRLPLDLEHDYKLSGAAGWITQLRMREDGGVDALVTWLRRGQQLLAEDRFRYVSPEWYTEWTQPDTGKVYTNVLTGGALTNKPFFKQRSLDGLPSRVAASEAAGGTAVADVITTGATNSTPPAKDDTNAAAAAAAVTPPVVQASEDIQHKQFAEMQAQVARLSQQNAALVSANEANASQLKQAAEALLVIQTREQTKRFTEEVMGRSDANNTRWFGDIDKHVSILAQMSKAFGEDSETLKAYVEQQRAVAAQIQAGALFSTLGKTGIDEGDVASAAGKVEAQARKFTEADPSLTKAKAIERVLTNDPGLYARYQEERKKNIRNAGGQG